MPGGRRTPTRHVGGGAGGLTHPPRPGRVLLGRHPTAGGTDHVNEQWQEHWAELFAQRGFSAFDSIRQRFWWDNAVDAYYLQNMLLYVHRESQPELAHRLGPTPTGPLSVVHPRMFVGLADRFAAEVRSAQWYAQRLEPRNIPVRQWLATLPAVAVESRRTSSYS